MHKVSGWITVLNRLIRPSLKRWHGESEGSNLVEIQGKSDLGRGNSHRTSPRDESQECLRNSVGENSRKGGHKSHIIGHSNIDRAGDKWIKIKGNSQAGILNSNVCEISSISLKLQFFGFLMKIFFTRSAVGLRIYILNELPRMFWYKQNTFWGPLL